MLEGPKELAAEFLLQDLADSDVLFDLTLI